MFPHPQKTHKVVFFTLQHLQHDFGTSQHRS